MNKTLQPERELYEVPEILDITPVTVTAGVGTTDPNAADDPDNPNLEPEF